MKKSSVSVALVALVLGWPGGASGQQALQPPGPPRPPRARAFSFGDHHGRLGVLVNTGADPAMDSVGARLEAVTPGGPAAKAGLKAGDIITRFNGTALAGVRAEDEDESGPGQKLVQLARALAPGDTVQIEYRRGSDSKKTTLVAAEVSGMGRMMGMDRVELTAPHIMQMLPGLEGGFSFCFGDAWCDMELVSLNPDLGDYFGTKEGVLVVKAPADSSLPLKSGDVILAIGARKPTSASHAMRILRSYDTGETVTIDVMRKQKRTSVTWHVPSHGDRGEGHPHMRVHHDSDEDDPS